MAVGQQQRIRPPIQATRVKQNRQALTLSKTQQTQIQEQINQVATETAQEQIQKQNLRQSLELVRELIGCAIGSISYLRAIIPEDSFCFSQYGGNNHEGQESQDTYTSQDIPSQGSRKRKSDRSTRVTLLRRGYSDEADTLLDWIETGIFDALSKGYLRAFQFAIFVDQEHPEILYEAYTFTVDYQRDNSGIVTGYGGLTLKDFVFAGELQNAMEAEINVAESRKQIQLLLRSLISVTQNLGALPDQRYLTIRLYHTKETPEDYAPPNFAPSTGKAFQLIETKTSTPVTQTLGKFYSGFHAVTVKLATTHTNTEAAPHPKRRLTKVIRVDQLIDEDHVKLSGVSKSSETSDQIAQPIPDSLYNTNKAPLMQGEKRKILQRNSLKNALPGQINRGAPSTAAILQDTEAVPNQENKFGDEPKSQRSLMEKIEVSQLQQYQATSQQIGIFKTGTNGLTEIQDSNHCTRSSSSQDITPTPSQRRSFRSKTLQVVKNSENAGKTAKTTSQNTIGISSQAFFESMEGFSKRTRSSGPSQEITIPDSPLNSSSRDTRTRRENQLEIHGMKGAVQMRECPVTTSSQLSGSPVFEIQKVPLNSLKVAELLKVKGRITTPGQNDQVRCTCGYAVEVGDMVCCYICETWQHLHCHGYAGKDDDRIPENHVCYNCLLGTNQKKTLDDISILALARRVVKILWRSGIPKKEKDFSIRLGCEAKAIPRLMAKLVNDGFVTSTTELGPNPSHKKGAPKVLITTYKLVRENGMEARLNSIYFDPFTKIYNHFEQSETLIHDTAMTADNNSMLPRIQNIAPNLPLKTINFQPCRTQSPRLKDQVNVNNLTKTYDQDGDDTTSDENDILHTPTSDDDDIDEKSPHSHRINNSLTKSTLSGLPKVFTTDKNEFHVLQTLNELDVDEETDVSEPESITDFSKASKYRTSDAMEPMHCTEGLE